jgi:hypothetical protein
MEYWILGKASYERRVPGFEKRIIRGNNGILE